MKRFHNQKFTFYTCQKKEKNIYKWVIFTKQNRNKNKSTPIWHIQIKISYRNCFPYKYGVIISQ